MLLPTEPKNITSSKDWNEDSRSVKPASAQEGRYIASKCMTSVRFVLIRIGARQDQARFSFQKGQILYLRLIRKSFSCH